MIDSRDPKELHPAARRRVEAFLADCNTTFARLGVTVIAICTYRDHAAQDALYAKGRTRPGEPCWCGGKANKPGTCSRHPRGATVTNARGGQSWHNYRLAVDVLPLRHGKPVWGQAGNGIDDNPADDATDDLELWQRIGALGEKHGLEWAGRWKGSLRETAHFQFTGGLSLKDLQAGKTLPEGA